MISVLVVFEVKWGIARARSTYSEKCMREAKSHWLRAEEDWAARRRGGRSIVLLPLDHSRSTPCRTERLTAHCGRSGALRFPFARFCAGPDAERIPRIR